MKAQLRKAIPAMLALFVLNAAAVTRYVDLNSPSPTPPYTNWPTAATNIQDAVDAATDGEEIVVTNGVYQTGAQAVYGMSNRVAVTKPLVVRSVNGPEVTVIQGYQVPGTTNGPAAIRCGYLANGAVLAGFTLTNGATQTSGNWYTNQSGGGVWCEVPSAVVSNCVLTGNSARCYGGGAYSGTLNDCTLSGNSATGPYGDGGGASFGRLTNCILCGNSANWFGGGAYDSTLNNCTLNGNSAYYGGAAASATLDSCVLTGNLAHSYGGGAYSGTLTNCTLSVNSSSHLGGGAVWGKLDNCTLSGNWSDSGGGVYSCSLNRCTLSGNNAFYGGGADSSTLTNCSLIGNSAGYSGGGALFGTLDNCILSGNSADAGGGACEGTLNNCVLISNSAVQSGGGVVGGILNNCTLIGNSANNCNGGGACEATLTNCNLCGNSAYVSGGGACSSALNNCIVYYNTARNGTNYYDSDLEYSCTTPMPSDGVGNITSAPLFVNTNGWSNLRLQSNSPCINGGNNAYVTTSTDLDGNPRIVGGTVDIGAYEFQSPSSVLSYAWAQQYGLATDGSADFTDADADRMNNWQEWRADTIPTNALSVLRMVTLANGPSGLDVSWQSVSTRNYWLERATNLSDTPPFQSIVTSIAGASGTTTYNDTSATNGGPYFYRVGVQP